ncbi:MAG: FAD-dependent oxidoreductase, partial [Thermoplasmata archaeon]|nr:FAD-dependent oxidoreductase [Thermoplasmata archaeon]
ASGIGIELGELAIDMTRIQEWKEGIINKMVKGIESQCKKAGVDILHGTAKLTSEKSVNIHFADGNPDEDIMAENIILATGSSPRDVPGFDIDEKTIMSSTGLLELDHIPSSMCVVGGGVVGLELATVMAKLGCDITIIEILDDILPFSDDDVTRTIKKGLKNLGITLHMGSQAKLNSMSENNVSVNIHSPSGTDTVEFEKILIGVGSRPNLEELGLEDVRILLDDDGFVKTNSELRTSIASIFAIGDIRGNPMLAHKASMDGIRVACTILGKGDAKEPVIPYVLFTEPELASAGLHEWEAKEKGIEYLSKRYYFAALGKALAMDEKEGFVKLLTDTDGKIIGGTIVGHEASNLISEITLAIEKGLTAKDISKIIHPHPTLAEGIWEGARGLVE